MKLLSTIFFFTVLSCFSQGSRIIGNAGTVSVTPIIDATSVSNLAYNGIYPVLASNLVYKADKTNITFPYQSRQGLSKPQMGFALFYAGYNGTNWYAGPGQTNIYCNQDEWLVLSMITNYINDGLHALGYNQCDLQIGMRYADGTPDLNTNLFPKGAKETVALIHSLGFNTRLFLDYTYFQACAVAGTPGTFGTNIWRDATNIVLWGIDNLTIDCDGWSSTGLPDTQDARRAVVEELVYALRTCGFSGQIRLHLNKATDWLRGYEPWMGSTVNSVMFNRGDANSWDLVLGNFDMSVTSFGQMSPWFQPSVLDFHPFEQPGSGPLNERDELEVAIAAILHSSMIFSEDTWANGNPGGVRPGVMKYQTNQIIIDINQDLLYNPPSLLKTNGTVEAWYEELSNNTFALLIFNRARTNVSTTNITLNVSTFKIPTNSAAKFLDIWTGTTYTSNSTFFIHVPTNNCHFFLVSDTNVVTGYLTNNQTGVTLSGAFSGTIAATTGSSFIGTNNGNPPPVSMTISGAEAFGWGGNGTASGTRSTSFGHFNVASGNYSFIAGGAANTASGEGAFVSGENNRATGQVSVAMGYAAHATANYAMEHNFRNTPARTNSVANSMQYDGAINGYSFNDGNVGLGTNTTPTMIAGRGYFWPSNYALYWVTPFKTNLITDGN